MSKNRIRFVKYMGKEDYTYFSCLVFNEQVMNMNMGRPFTVDEAIEYYDYMINNSECYKVFKINPNKICEYIGSAILRVNEDLIEAEIEYMILPDFWGNGYGTEIVGRLINYAKKNKSIKELIAITDPNNIRSKKVLQKNGFDSIRIYKVDENNKLAEMFKKNI